MNAQFVPDFLSGNAQFVPDWATAGGQGYSDSVSVSYGLAVSGTGFATTASSMEVTSIMSAGHGSVSDSMGACSLAVLHSIGHSGTSSSQDVCGLALLYALVSMTGTLQDVELTLISSHSTSVSGLGAAITSCALSESCTLAAQGVASCPVALQLSAPQLVVANGLASAFGLSALQYALAISSYAEEQVGQYTAEALVAMALSAALSGSAQTTSQTSFSISMLSGVQALGTATAALIQTLSCALSAASGSMHSAELTMPIGLQNILACIRQSSDSVVMWYNLAAGLIAAAVTASGISVEAVNVISVAGGTMVIELKLPGDRTLYVNFDARQLVVSGESRRLNA